MPTQSPDSADPHIGDDDVAQDVGAGQTTGTETLHEQPASPSSIEHVDGGIRGGITPGRRSRGAARVTR